MPLRTDSSTYCYARTADGPSRRLQSSHMTVITGSLGGGCATAKSVRDEIATGDGVTIRIFWEKLSTERLLTADSQHWG